MTIYDVFHLDKPLEEGQYYKFQNVGDGISGSFYGMHRDVLNQWGNKEARISIHTDQGNKTITLSEAQRQTLLNQVGQLRFGQRCTLSFERAVPSVNGKNDFKVIELVTDNKIDWHGLMEILNKGLANTKQ